MRYFLTALLVVSTSQVFGGSIFKEKNQKPKPAAKPTMAEFWKESGLELETARKILSDSFCYSPYLRNYIACVLAAQDAVSYASQGELVLTTKLHMDTNPEEYSEAVASIGDMRIAKSKFEPEGNVAEVFKAGKEKFERDLALVNRIAVTSPKTYDFDSLLSWLDRNYLNANNESMVTGKTVTKAMNVIFDPHTYIMPKAYFEYSATANSEQFAGVGISYSFMNGFLVVEKVIKNGPAAKAGLRTKDVIVQIDGVSLKGKTPAQLPDLIKGETGSDIVFTVQRDEQEFDILITRGTVKIENVEFEKLDNFNGDIGYIKLRSFMPENSCSDMKNAMSKLESQNELRGYILDLRNNGGGRLNLAVCIVNLFVGPNKTVVTARDPRTNEILEDLKTTEAKFTALPVVVLINSRSASASEIVSGALKDYERALIVGEKSFGKGTIQQTGAWMLSDKVTMAKTVGRFHMASGWSNQMNGVPSDIDVYRKPNPTDVDKFAIRESDEFLPIGSGPDVFEATKKRTEYVNSISNCMDKNEDAERAFEMDSTDYYDPDFQLLQAQDAVVCMHK